jgi:hypothetical protein
MLLLLLLLLSVLQEEISAAVALTSKALSPNQAPSSSSSTSPSDPTSSTASSYFYVRRHAAKFHVLSLHWDLLQGRRLLVVGYDQAQVWSVEPKDLTISDRLVLQLPAGSAATGGDEAGRVVSAAAWLPDSDTWVAVSTPLRVYLFDLTHSASQPAVVVQAQGHVLLSGGAAFVPRLVQQQQLEGEEGQVGGLQQQLYVLLLTREGQVLSAQLPQQLLDRLQSCTSHWPHVSCLHASSSSSSSGAGASPQSVSRSNSPGPTSAAPSGRLGTSGDGVTTGPGHGSSNSVYGWQQLVARQVSWPGTMPQLQTGRSCHWLQANSLLAVAGTGKPAAAAAADSSSSSSCARSEPEQQQLLLQLDATCSSILHCCRWDTADAAAPVLGSPKPLVLSPAAVYWDLPLLPAARAAYGAAQLLAVAPGQASQLLSSSSSSAAPGQGCAYVAGLVPPAATNSSSSSGGVWQSVVQPLHLRHSSAGAVVDGLAVLSFPYTQQLLLVVLCSKGNMYMYATRQPQALHPMQPYTRLLRQQLTHNPDQQQQGRANSTTDSHGAAAAGGDGPQGISRRAAAVAAATGVLAASASAAAQLSAGSTQPVVTPFDASVLLLQHCQNMNSHLSVSGDISRAGTAEAAARALFKTVTDPDRRLEGPNPGAGMTLVLKIASGCELQPVGLKLLLPGGGAAPVSVKLTCGDPNRSSSAGGGSSGAARPNSIAAIAAAARTAARAAAGAGAGTAAGSSGSNARTVQLAGGAEGSSGRSSSSGRQQRWYQVIFTPEESVAAAAAGQISLEFGAAVEGDRRLALCHMDLFGQAAEQVAERAKQQQQQQQQQQQEEEQVRAVL